MSNVTRLKPAAATRAKRLTPDEVQTLVRQAKAIVNGVRVCLDHDDEEASAYALEAANEVLERVDDALGFMECKKSSHEETPS